jgi:UV DNA damage endonuclease
MRLAGCVASIVMEKTTSRFRHRYGYACINTELAGQGITTNRSIQLKTFMAEGKRRCGELAALNISDLIKVLEWNKKNNIELYRMTSQLVPWGTEFSLEELPNWSELAELLAQAGKFVRDNGMRISFHPGPFNNLASPDPNVIANTIKDLEMHGHILDHMGMPQDHWSKVNIHLGGTYGSKTTALYRFEKNFKRLSSTVAKRLTLENDDRESLYSVSDLYSVHQSTGVPIVFDGHHWQVGAKSGSYEEDLLKAYKTWGDVTPTLHWSNSRNKWEDPTAKVTAHSDWYYESMSLPNLDCDIMLESKMKEQALLKYLENI